ncbi:MAG: hypothetical protein KDJ33_09090 [Gammaproteobacteria bacterium]|nr:hypothetical protein [Gammaproteobacteria bacterium]
MNNRKTICNALFVVALSAAVPVNADDDPRYLAVAGLGELNGVALQCKYLDQVRRMKAAVVEHAPKERSFGLAFDQATNDAFLAFARNNDVCPSHDGLERKVGHQIDRLAEAFAAR